MSLYKALKIANFSIGWCGNLVFLADLAQQLHRKTTNVLDIYVALRDSAGISPTLVLNQNARAKERGSCVPFKKRMSVAAKIVKAG